MDIKAKISDIDLNDSKTVFKFSGTILELQNEGDPSSKRPIRFTVKFEDSGEVATCITWEFNMLPIIQMAVKETNVYEFESTASVFRDILNLKINTITKTTKISDKKKIVEADDENVLKEQFQDIVKKYVKNTKLQSILNEVLEIPDFYTKPAAKSVHHAYQGGLATHTLGVTKIVMNLYLQYKDKVSLELLIAGAIVHDIGKIYEYTNDGQISFEGSFVGHIPMGISIITSIANSLGIDVSDPVVLQLLGIIASHHGKLEYGSPNVPTTLEELLVSFADNIDASMETAIENLINLPENARTNSIWSLENAQFIKVDNKKLLRNGGTE